MRLSSYQPQYFPRLHYFARILDSDVFTISDYLQYVRRHSYLHADGSSHRGPSFQAHSPIKTGNGTQLLDIPVRHGGLGGKQRLDEARIDYSAPWQQQNVNSIHNHYYGAPHYGEIFPSLSLLMSQRYSSLAEYTTATILWGLGQVLDVRSNRPKGPSLEEINAALPHAPFRLKKIVRMSDTDIVPADKEKRDANDWLIETCRHFGADEYYFGGTGAAAYMDFSKFERAGIKLAQQDWHAKPYPQRGNGFIANLSIIDLLMNVSPAEARDILHTQAPVGA